MWTADPISSITWWPISSFWKWLLIYCGSWCPPPRAHNVYAVVRYDDDKGQFCLSVSPRRNRKPDRWWLEHAVNLVTAQTLTLPYVFGTTIFLLWLDSRVIFSLSIFRQRCRLSSEYGYNGTFGTGYTVSATFQRKVFLIFSFLLDTCRVPWLF